MEYNFQTVILLLMMFFQYDKKVEVIMSASPCLLTRLSVLLICAGVLFSPLAYALEQQDSLTLQISAILNNNPQSPVTSVVTILTPEKQLAELCENPQLTLAGSNMRISGNRSVIAQCGSQRKYLQIKIQANGRWWTASHALKTGSTITAEDIKTQSGSMDKLPGGVILREENIVGQVTMRAINVGQPFVESHIRKRWAVIGGQEVDVLALGDGFQIRTRGKAIDNAALNESVRVKTNSGQIINGKVTSEGNVGISLKE